MVVFISVQPYPLETKRVEVIPIKVWRMIGVAQTLNLMKPMGLIIQGGPIKSTQIAKVEDNFAI